MDEVNGLEKLDTGEVGVDVLNSPITSKDYNIPNGQIIADVIIIKIRTTTAVKVILLLLTKSKSRRGLVTTASFQQEGSSRD